MAPEEQWIVQRRLDEAAPIEASRPGQLCAGARVVDITPQLGLPLTGYGFLGGRFARGFVGRLYASVLVVEDGHGEAVALVAADLHAGSRYIVEAMASVLGPQIGLTVDRILLAGSHTHAGPGHFYGSAYYDNLAGPGEKGFDFQTTRWIALRLTRAVKRAWDDREPAALGYGTSRAAGLSWNRSLPSFGANGGDLEALIREVNEGEPSDTGLGASSSMRAVDQRVHCIAARATEGDGALIGAFATFGAHPTLGPRYNDLYSGDAFGAAVRHARSALGGRPMGLVGGTLGDANVVAHPDDLGLSDADDAGDLLRELGRRRTDAPGRPWLELVEMAGERLGSHLVEACGAALQAAAKVTAPQRVHVAYVEPRLPGAVLKEDPEVRLADEGEPGLPSMKGGDFGKGWWSSFFEGRNPSEDDFDPSHPQHPKSRLVWPYRGIQKSNGAVPFTMPMRQYVLGDLVVVGLPVEVTSYAGHLLRSALRETATVHERFGTDAPVMVCSPAGDYMGYLTTQAEYEEQEYEGASTMWGRYSERWVRGRLVDLASTPRRVEQPVAVFRGRFATASPRLEAPRQEFFGPIWQPRHILKKPKVRGDRVALRGVWRGTPETGPIPVAQEVGDEPKPWLTLLAADELDSTFEVFATDLDAGFQVFRHVTSKQFVWRWEVELPLEKLRGKWVKLRITAPDAVLDEEAESVAWHVT